MRFLLIPAPLRSGGRPPATQPFDTVFEAHMRYNEEMFKAGVLVKSEGLNPAGPSAHVLIDGEKRTVVDGSYAETKELLLGFYVIDVKSLEEAVAWAKRYPGGMGNDDVIEVRPLMGAADIPVEFLEKIKRFAPAWGTSFVEST